MFRHARTFLALTAATAVFGTLPSADAATGIGYPAPARTAATTATSGICAVPVTRYLPHLRTGDDTSAFQHAIADAEQHHRSCFPHGPSGAPQAVVTVPAGTYRLANLTFPSNLRLEVSAAATLEQPATHRAGVRDLRTPLIVWDSPANGQPPVSNVSIVGVGSALTATKQHLAGTDPAMDRAVLAHSFTAQLDPRVTGSSNSNPAILLSNVTHFLISNVFSVQDATNQPKVLHTPNPWPTSTNAVLVFFARHNSPLAGPFLEPRYGTISNHINVNSPAGYGPNQVSGAQDVSFTNIYSRGGTALRLETDAAMTGQGLQNRGENVDRITATHIVGRNCNRAVSFAPHVQRNGSAHVSDVWSYDCYEGAVANVDQSVGAAKRGSFTDARLDGLHVLGGPGAQNKSTSSLWQTGVSYLPVFVNKQNTWHPVITVTAKAGQFTG